MLFTYTAAAVHAQLSTTSPVSAPVNAYSVAVVVREASEPKALPPTVTFNLASVPDAPEVLTLIDLTVPAIPLVLRTIDVVETNHSIQNLKELSQRLQYKVDDL